MLSTNGATTTDTDKFNSQVLHKKNSKTGLDAPIQIGDAFSGLTDGLLPYLDYPSGCYTYLGKKWGDTPGSVVNNGAVIAEVDWAGHVDVSGAAYDLSVGSCEDDCAEPELPQTPEFGCMDPTACNYDAEVGSHDQELCCYVIGCTDDLAYNYNSFACCDNVGACCYLAGCNDETAVNYNVEACFDDGTCCYVAGCTNPTAANYDALACLDDGSCVIPEEGGYKYGVWCVTNPGSGDNPDVTSTYYRTLKPGLLDTIGLPATQNLVNGSWGCTDLMAQLLIPQSANEIKSWINMPRILQGGDTVVYDANPGFCKTYIGVIDSVTDLTVNGGTSDLDLGGGVTIPYLNSGPCPPIASTVDYTIVNEKFNTQCGTCCDKIADPNCDISGGCDEPLAYNYDANASSPDNTTCIWKVPRYCTTTRSPGAFDNGCGGRRFSDGGGGDDQYIENIYIYGDPNLALQPDFGTGTTLKDNIGYLLGYFLDLPGMSGGYNMVPSQNFHVGYSSPRLCFTWVGWDTFVGDGSILFNEIEGFGVSLSPVNTGQTVAVEGLSDLQVLHTLTLQILLAELLVPLHRCLIVVIVVLLVQMEPLINQVVLMQPQ